MRTEPGKSKFHMGMLRALLLLVAACAVGLGVQAAKAARPTNQPNSAGTAAAAAGPGAPSAPGTAESGVTGRPFTRPGRLSFSPTSSVWCVATTAGATGAPCANPTAVTSLQVAVNGA